MTANPKTTLYVGGLEDSVVEATVHEAFVPFGDIKDINIPLDQTTQKHRGFGFVTFLEKEDAAAAMDNMHNAELYGKILTVNIAAPMKIKGGDQGWASQPVWADADTWFERQQREEEMKKLKKEHDATVASAVAQGQGQGGGQEQEQEQEQEGEQEAGGGSVDPMAAAEADALGK